MDFFKRRPKGVMATGGSQVNPAFAHRLQLLQHAPLDPAVRAELTTVAQNASAAFVAFCTSPKVASAFTYLGDPQRVQLYEGRVHERYVVKGVTTLPGTVHDVLSALAMHSTSSLVATMLQLFGKAFDQGMTLHSGEGRDDSGLCLHWLSLLAGKDMCDADAIDVVMASHTQYYEADPTDAMELVATPMYSPSVVAGSQVWESTDLLRSLAPLPSRRPTPRLRLRTSGFFVEKTVSDRGLCDQVVTVTFVLSLDPCPGVRSVERWLQGLVTMGAHELSRVARQGSVRLVPRAQWTRSNMCTQCTATFRLFRRRHHCRLCGGAVCGSCSCAVDLDYPVLGTGEIVRHATVRSCTRCAFESHTIAPRITASGRSHSEPQAMAASDPTPAGRRRVWSVQTPSQTPGHTPSQTPGHTPKTWTSFSRSSSSYIDFSDSECGTPVGLLPTPLRRTGSCNPIAEADDGRYKPLDRAERMRRRAKAAARPPIKLIADDLLEELLMTTTQSQDEDGIRLSQLDLSASPSEYPSLSSRGAVARLQEKQHERATGVVVDVGLEDALASKRYSERSEDMICLPTQRYERDL
ncbi:hypothetical protein ACHHYP_15374 [Achlya hypogyna]|uniref:FYVE-type domain-containing protein n=1 Tax=Achlya hypogyna TaxID=1202772 RepID=A0A1V9YB14_ACHHY|nr:hypothetical protein ACHHYP_15374 [Achlya hypogyna]